MRINQKTMEYKIGEKYKVTASNNNRTNQIGEFVHVTEKGKITLKFPDKRSSSFLPKNIKKVEVRSKEYKRKEKEEYNLDENYFDRKEVKESAKGMEVNQQEVAEVANLVRVFKETLHIALKQQKEAFAEEL